MKSKTYDDISSIFRGIIIKDGGEGSGNFGHEGRPGKVGGSGKSAFMKYLDSDVLKNPEKHSVGKYIENGKLSNNRKKLHNEAIKKYFKGVETTENPVIYFNGGGSASGKTTAISKLFPEVPSASNKRGIVVDPDELKKDIPEYNELKSKNDSTAAGFAHEESSALAKKLFSKAVNSKEYDVLMDGTLAGKTEKAKKKILDAKKSGSPVVGNFATVDIDEALKRNYLRYLRTGRFPSVDTVIKNHKEVSVNYPELAGLFNKSALIDNNGKEPVVIAKSGEDGKLKILDKEKYNKFINKTKESDDEIKQRFKKMIPVYEKEYLKNNPGAKLKSRPKI